MSFLPYIYLFYMFVSLYFLFFYLIIYSRNKKDMYAFPKITKRYSVGVLIPAWNEEDVLEDTVKSVLASEYPIKEIIIIDDASTDKTGKIADRLARQYKIIKVIHHKTNLRKAGALNTGIKAAHSELLAVIDCQSYLQPDSIMKLVGYFDDPKVGVASGKILVRNKSTILGKLQSLEYSIIAFNRKLLGYVDSIYVTPGPLSLYRRKALIETSGFDTKNLTEDIEKTWNLVYHGWSVKMSLASHVETVAPEKLKKWWRQRNRWNIGGLQCLWKYKKTLFRGGHNMLGWFIAPYFAATLFLGLLGLSVFAYLLIRKFLSAFLFSKYSIAAGTPIITLNEFYFTASVLNFLGLALFLFGLIFAIVGLRMIKPKGIKIYSPFLLALYLLIYLTVYPIILIGSIFRIIKGDYGWW